MAGTQYCVQLLNDNGWLKEHDNKIKQDLLDQIENISNCTYYPNGETKELVIPIHLWYELFY